MRVQVKGSAGLVASLNPRAHHQPAKCIDYRAAHRTAGGKLRQGSGNQQEECEDGKRKDAQRKAQQRRALKPAKDSFPM